MKINKKLTNIGQNSRTTEPAAIKSRHRQEQRPGRRCVWRERRKFLSFLTRCAPRNRRNRTEPAGIGPWASRAQVKRLATRAPAEHSGEWPDAVPSASSFLLHSKLISLQFSSQLFNKFIDSSGTWGGTWDLGWDLMVGLGGGTWWWEWGLGVGLEVGLVP